MKTRAPKRALCLLLSLFLLLGALPLTAFAATDISVGTIAPIPDQPYTGAPIQPSVTVTVGGATLTPGTDYSVAYSNNTGAGQNTAIATVTGINTYTCTLTANFTITPANISTATVAPIAAQAYTGDAIEPALGITAGTNTLTSGTDYTVAYTGNYTGTLPVNFTITPANISTATVDPIPTQTWTGNLLEPPLTVTWNGRTLASNQHYTVAYGNSAGVGPATANITGTGNFTGVHTVPFSIKAVPSVSPLNDHAFGAGRQTGPYALTLTATSPAGAGQAASGTIALGGNSAGNVNLTYGASNSQIYPEGDLNALAPGVYPVRLAVGETDTTFALPEMTLMNFIATGVRGVTVSPATVRRGGSHTFAANVDAVDHTSLPGVDRAVRWSLTGNTSPGTAVDPATGRLTVAADEGADALTLTATSVWTHGATNQPVTGTATVTVTGQAPTPVNHDPLTPPTAPIDIGRDFTATFPGEWANLRAIRLNGQPLTITPTGPDTAGLGGYPGYTGTVGSARAGSVVVTLDRAFLNWLPGGVYTLEAEFDDGGVAGVGSLAFTIEKPPASRTTPRPGDASPLGPWAALLALSLAAFVSLVLTRRRLLRGR